MMNAARKHHIHRLGTDSCNAFGPTVGSCGRARPSSKTKEVEFTPGEVVHVHAPESTVVVQTIGGTLPPFAFPQSVFSERQDAELVILRAAPWTDNSEDVPECLRVFDPSGRVIVADEALAGRLSRPGALPCCDLWIDAIDECLDVVAEALAALLVGELLVCVGWTDLERIAGRQKCRPGRGRGFVIGGMGGDVAARTREHLQRLADEGFNGGWCLIQLVAPEDDAGITLEGLDQFATTFRHDESERDLLVTAVFNASCTAIIGIAFDAASAADLSRP